MAYFYILRFLYTSKAILSVILPICENLTECWFAYRVMHAYYKTLRTQFILCWFWGSWNRAIPFMFGLLHSFDFLFDWSDFSIVNYLLFQSLRITSKTFIFLIFIPRMVTQKVLIRCRNSVVFANWQKYLLVFEICFFSFYLDKNVFVNFISYKYAKKKRRVEVQKYRLLNINRQIKRSNDDVWFDFLISVDDIIFD